ncbi:hypothetical protein KJ885_03765 [Patescibacteria group bacterium]|nr:hypothetical protein [Patescibacteria group bacterium]
MENLLFILLLALVIGVFVAGIFIIRNLKKPDLGDTRNIKEKWEEIEGLMKADSVLSWKMAVIEADKLMDSALKRAMMRGQTMGERLRFAVSKHPKIRSVWEAHILRNDLVHEASRTLNKNEAQKALVLFKQGLKLLGAL